MRTAAMAFAALVLTALAGCQAPDVGAQCKFGVTLPSTLAGDYVESGNTGCDNLVCIASPLASNSKVKWDPYCSKPCVADSDCSPSDTGLSCRKVVLDDTFLATLSPEVKQRYLGDTSAFSQYCAAPLLQ